MKITLKNLKLVLNQYPSPLFNCESSDQINKKFKKRCGIVPNNDNETNYYYSEVKKGSIYVCRWNLVRFNVLSINDYISHRKTVETDINLFGLPDSSIGYLTFSDTGYVKGSLFLNASFPNSNKKGHI